MKKVIIEINDSNDVFEETSENEQMAIIEKDDMYAIIHHDGSIYMEGLIEDEAVDEFDKVTRHILEDKWPIKTYIW